MEFYRSSCRYALCWQIPTQMIPWCPRLLICTKLTEPSTRLLPDHGLRSMPWAKVSGQFAKIFCISTALLVNKIALNWCKQIWNSSLVWISLNVYLSLILEKQSQVFRSASKFIAKIVHIFCILYCMIYLLASFDVQCNLIVRFWYKSYIGGNHAQKSAVPSLFLQVTLWI